MFKPAIIVVAYKKEYPLKRLLNSLAKAHYSNQVELIISIDKGGSRSVKEIASGFSWEYGEKTVITQDEHLGLRNHILKCGDMTEEFGSIILLEDDLFVSPVFYEYTLKALNFYKNEDRIAGISLYSPVKNMFTRMTFTPLLDDSDVFFLQIPASWGEAWSYDQWSKFKSWYKDNNTNIPQNNRLPKRVYKWPESSWAKYFWCYLVENNKFFVYPRKSLTTQFGEVGLHSTNKTAAFQSPLLFSGQSFRFTRFTDSFAVYDPFYEILPEKLNQLTNKFQQHGDFTIDLNETKEIDRIDTDLIITPKKCKKAIYSFGMDLLPLELNLIENIPGDDIFFCTKESISESKYSRFIRKQRAFLYRGNIPTKKMFFLFILRLLRKL